MSKITVTTIAGATSGADANKVKIESGDDFNVVSGKVGIGTVNAPSNKNIVTPSLNVSGSGVNGAAQITRHTSVGVGGALLHLSGTRGSDVNSYTIVQNNDGIGTVSFQGADGNEFVQGAAIQANVDGTPDDNDMPTRLGFFVTADGASTSTERMRIHNGGVVSFNNGIELGSGLDATAANVLDDYEEGTWTATLGGLSSNPTVSAYAYNSGHYTKIGRQVFAHIYMRIEAGNISGGSGDATILGLPFTSKSGGSISNGAGAWIENYTYSSTSFSSGRSYARPVMVAGENRMRIYQLSYSNPQQATGWSLGQADDAALMFGGVMVYKTD